MVGPDADTIRHALRTAREFGFRTVRLQSGDTKFRAILEPSDPDSDESFYALDAESVPDNGPVRKDVTATAVGYFSGADLALGRVLARGDKVGVITALGLPNDVSSLHDGEIKDVLVKDGEPVEFGQVLAVVESK